MRRLMPVFALVLCSAASAQAEDTYTVDLCATEAGGPATVDGWTFGNAGTQSLVCPSPGIVASEPPGSTGHLGGFDLTFTAPSATRIAAYRLWRTVRLQPDWNYT